MVSKWYSFKSEAIKLRQNGLSIRNIEKQLKIPKSTLSFWFKNIRLTNLQKDILHKNWKTSLANARKKALMWHHSQREKRMQIARNCAEAVISRIDVNNRDNVELALAFLYLGEGSKTDATSLGNTDSLILRFFISAVKLVCKDAKLAKCELHLRSDQNGPKEIKYWAKELKIPNKNFSFIKDKRVAKSKTYLNYHGVCVVRFTSVAIQRRLVFLSHKFCNIITELDP